MLYTFGHYIRKLHMGKPKNGTVPSEAPNEAPSNVMNPNTIPMPEGFVVEDTGFPPYWNPTPGAAFCGVVIDRDDRDPKFIRYRILASSPILCARGPADDAEPVHVNAGEMFTVSFYAALPLDDYMGFEVYVLAKEKVKGGKEKDRGGTVWQWKLGCAPETKQIVARRKADALIAALHMKESLTTQQSANA
jgi:hypothetical protein